MELDGLRNHIWSYLIKLGHDTSWMNIHEYGPYYMDIYGPYILFDNSIGEVQVKGSSFLKFSIKWIGHSRLQKSAYIRDNTLRGFLSIPNEALVSCIEMKYHEKKSISQRASIKRYSDQWTRKYSISFLK